MVPPLHSGYYVSVMELLFQPLLLEPKSVASCGMEYLLHNTSFLWALTSIKNGLCGDFPGGPVAKILRAQCMGPGFNPRLEK